MAGDERGGVMVWFGLGIVPLLFLAGAGLDLARGVNQQSELQAAVDAAALAGASAYVGVASLSTATATATNYMNNFKTSSGLPITFTVTPGTVIGLSSITLYKVTVTASAPINNTLMAMAKRTNTIGATATAQNPVYNITISLSSFSSSAVDTDAISYYIVPSDGSIPTATVPLFTNAAGSTTSTGGTTFQVTASQKIGFMLTNTTDGNAVQSCRTLWSLLKGNYQSCTSNSYGNNQYGGTPGSTHYFYSHLFPPSKIAYPSVATNRSLQAFDTSGATPAKGEFSSLPANAAVNCVQASGQTLYYYWNDMGGTTDDLDYNDAVYTVTCSKVDTNVSKGLVLTN